MFPILLFSFIHFRKFKKKKNTAFDLVSFHILLAGIYFSSVLIYPKGKKFSKGKRHCRVGVLARPVNRLPCEHEFNAQRIQAKNHMCGTGPIDGEAETGWALGLSGQPVQPAGQTSVSVRECQTWQANLTTWVWSSGHIAEEEGQPPKVI